MSDDVSVREGASQKACAIRPRVRRTILRPAVDAVAAWVVFGMLTAFVTCAPLTAATSPASFAGLQNATNAVAIHAVADPASATPTVNLASARSGAQTTYFQANHNTTAVTLLGLTFSLFAALNLMLFRHLRRAYALPRKRALKAK